MPYVVKSRRPLLDMRVRAALNEGLRMHSAGELNYCITRLILQYKDENRLSYQTINDIRGALACASDEFYRRVAVPYEQSKIDQNGDVYE